MDLHGSFRLGFILAILWIGESNAYSHEGIIIDVEHAISPQQRAWGLMQRRHLSGNHGMLFHYPKPTQDSFWMFNTYIDLSIAFLDRHGVIREIHELHAHPELMEKLPSIRRPQELSRLPPYTNAAMKIFDRESVTPSFAISYALEMPSHWFEDHSVELGDRLIINDSGQVVIESRRKRPNT